jgi:hypothetical protein
MRVVTPGEIPPRDEAPVNNALHHMRCAFAGYKAELEERTRLRRTSRARDQRRAR